MNPPVEGDSTIIGTAGVTGTNSASDNGIGVRGTSINGEGVHGETNSGATAAVAGFNNSTTGTGAGTFGETLGPGPCVLGPTK
jgi:hypothetical protein